MKLCYNTSILLMNILLSKIREVDKICLIDTNIIFNSVANIILLVLIYYADPNEHTGMKL